MKKQNKVLFIWILIVVLIAIVECFIYNKSISKNNNSTSVILDNLDKKMEEQAMGEDTLKHVMLGEIEYVVFEEHKEKGTVDLISKNALGLLTLGSKDEGAKGSTDLEKAIWSYNNAIETIVKYCKEITGLEVDGTTVKSIRSVGNRDVKYTKRGIEGNDTTKFFKNSDIKLSKVYKIKNSDTNFETDLNRIIDLNINNARNILDSFERKSLRRLS